jgi:RES domain-containing protein
LNEERLRNDWRWWRIAEISWKDPLDPNFAKKKGGRWNPPGRFAALYLNEDKVTARLNLREFISQWPYEPEDLRAENGPVLVGATIPRDQSVCDIHTPAGVKAAKLPKTYPFDAQGILIPQQRCQPIGQKIKDQSLRGVRCRSAQTRDGAGRELAWFPATTRSRARPFEILTFDDWFWA